MKSWIAFLAPAGLLACNAPEPSATPEPESSPATVTASGMTAEQEDPALRPYLQAQTRDALSPLGYVARTSGEGLDRLTLVRLIGPEYCGSGGCQLLVLGAQGDPFANLGNVSIVNTPVRILETSTNGRPDIGVQVRGGGISEPYEAILKFNGTRYPSNPSVIPGVTRNVGGTVVIAEGDAVETLKK